MRRIPDKRQFHRAVRQKVYHRQTFGERAGIARDLPPVRADRRNSCIPPILPVEMAGQPCQRGCRHGVRAGCRPIGSVAAAQNERLMTPGCGEESTLFCIHKVGQQPISKSCRRLQIPLRSPGLVEIDEPFGQIGVIFQIGIEMRPANTRGPQEPPIRSHVCLQQEVRSLHRRIAIPRLTEHPGCFSHRRQHHAVPCGQHFIVEPRSHALLTRTIEQGLQPGSGLR